MQLTKFQTSADLASHLQVLWRALVRVWQFARRDLLIGHGRRWFGIGLLAILLFVGYKVARTGYLAWNAYGAGTTLLQTAQSDLNRQTVPTLQPHAQRLSRSLAGLEAELRLVSPLLNTMEGRSRYGSTIAAVPELLSVAADLSQVGADGLQLVSPVLTADQPLEALSVSLESNATLLDRMTAGVEQANLTLLSLDPSILHPSLSDPIALAQQFSPYMSPALRMGSALPDLLGNDEPVHYLLLLQNNHELRSTGGFISAIGELTVYKATVEDLSLGDSYDLFDENAEYPLAPEPMQEYMDIELLLPRDANWSPDLPTSARTVRHLYDITRGVELDGVITVDLRAVQLVIEGLGGLELEGLGGRITGDNVIDILVQLWNNPLGSDADINEDQAEWWQQRKDFMPNMADAMFQKLQSGQVNYFQLLQAGQRALNERAVQVWLEDREASSQLRTQGWDGALHTVNGADFLALVDTNMGYNKVNAVVTRTLAYEVEWPDGPGQPALATATVTYHHPTEVPDHVCDVTPRYGDTYEDMFRRCYFNYVRLFVPRDSKLISIEGVQEESVSTKRGEVRTQTLAGYFILKPGEARQITFTYELPPSIQPETYHLILQRQAGSGALPVRWTVDNTTDEQTITTNWIEWKLPQ